MAKLTALALAFLLVAALTGTASAADLETGSRGPRVAAVQKWLRLDVDRVYGSTTRRAVRRFQRRLGLEADGVVGTTTWRALKRRHADGGGRRRRSAARPGSGGRLVKRLQRALGIAADGVFGPGTQRAVKRFQKRRDLTADGVVGPATWTALGHRGTRTVLKRRRARSGVPLRVRRVIAAGSRIAHKPYKYGGGHARLEDSGYDCSGSVSYALRGARLLSGSLTSGGFTTWGAAGRGRWITIYASPGHVYMVVNGRRFDTTGRGSRGSRWQWAQRGSSGYVARHPRGL